MLNEDIIRIANLLTEDPDILNEINSHYYDIGPEDVPERFTEHNPKPLPQSEQPQPHPRFVKGIPPLPFEKRPPQDVVHEYMFIDAVEALMRNGYKPIRRNKALQEWTMGGYTVTITFQGNVRITMPNGEKIYTVKLAELSEWLQQEHL